MLIDKIDTTKQERYKYQQKMDSKKTYEAHKIESLTLMKHAATIAQMANLESQTAPGTSSKRASQCQAQKNRKYKNKSCNRKSVSKPAYSSGAIVLFEFRFSCK